jgi:hypothetical protein
MSNKFVEVETPRVRIVSGQPSLEEMENQGYQIGDHYFLRGRDGDKTSLYPVRMGWCPEVSKVSRENLGRVADSFKNRTRNSQVWSLAEYVE